MSIVIVIIGIAVVAAVIFLVQKRPESQKNHLRRAIPPEAQGENTGNSVGNDIKTLADMLKATLKGLQETLAPSELSYEKAMKYFIEHKDDSPAIAKGALLKEAAADGLVITQVFLDKDNNIVSDGKRGRPLGVRIRVKRLDSELLKLFKDTDLIIVE